MNKHHFEAEITWSGWAAEVEALEERVYGEVRVRAEWNVPGDAPVIRVPLRVIDERERGDARDIPAFVELFFHDAFLLLNLATPGSFGGVISVTGGVYRVRELIFDARVFESAKRSFVPLREVVRWYDALQIGTRQLSTSPEAKALFHLLHLARGPENDEMSVLRLAQCAEVLNVTESLAPLFALRDAIVRGTAPVLHPMQDDALDASIDEHDWTVAVDHASSAVVRTLQTLAHR